MQWLTSFLTYREGRSWRGLETCLNNVWMVALPSSQKVSTYSEFVVLVHNPTVVCLFTSASKQILQIHRIRGVTGSQPTLCLPNSWCKSNNVGPVTPQILRTLFYSQRHKRARRSFLERGDDENDTKNIDIRLYTFRSTIANRGRTLNSSEISTLKENLHCSPW